MLKFYELDIYHVYRSGEGQETETYMGRFETQAESAEKAFAIIKYKKHYANYRYGGGTYYRYSVAYAGAKMPSLIKEYVDTHRYNIDYKVSTKEHAIITYHDFNGNDYNQVKDDGVTYDAKYILDMDHFFSLNNPEYDGFEIVADDKRKSLTFPDRYKEKVIFKFKERKL